MLLGWTSREDVLGKHTQLVTKPLQTLPKKVAAALEEDAAAVARFLARD